MTEERELLRMLESKDKSEVLNALDKIRKSYVRNSTKMKRLPQKTVIKLLISFIEDPRYCNLALSIVADACLQKNLVFSFIQYNVIESLIRLMKNLNDDDILNRACRALGNIAKNKAGLKETITLESVSDILQFLTGTKDKICQQTAIRTLCILGKDLKSRNLIIRENGIIYIAKLLNSSCKEVLLCTTKALAELSENCSISCARQILEMQSLKMLVELYSHSEEIIKTHILASLKNLSSQEEIRSDLIKVGAVKLFIEVATKCESYEMRKHATLALCSCFDHLHMWDSYGISKHNAFKAILDILQSTDFEDIHFYIIASLLPLSYENTISLTLCQLEIIKILLQNLKTFISKNNTYHLASISNSQSSIKNDAPKLDNPQDSEPFCDDELSGNSVDYASYKNNYAPKTDVVTITTKREVTPLDFFFPTNFSNILGSVKNTYKTRNTSHLNFHGSGASSYCSPSSSGGNSAASPNFSSDFNAGSPVADSLSPHTNTNERFLSWSPVYSSSDASDNGQVETEISIDSKTESENCENVVCADNNAGFSPCTSDEYLVSPDNSNKTDRIQVSSNMFCCQKRNNSKDSYNEDNEYSPSKKHESIFQKNSTDNISFCSAIESCQKNAINTYNNPQLNQNNSYESKAESVKNSYLFVTQKGKHFPKDCNDNAYPASKKYKVGTSQSTSNENTVSIKKNEHYEKNAVYKSKESKHFIPEISEENKLPNKRSTLTSSSSNKTVNIKSYVSKSSPGKEKTHDDEDDKELISNKRKPAINVQINLDESVGEKNVVPSSRVIHKLESSENLLYHTPYSIDNLVLSLLIQLSFHLEKRNNSEIAGKACFSVVMDYISCIPNPNPKAEKFLLSLIKNRYSFEKLIASGFLAEMESQISILHNPTKCDHCMKLNITNQKLLSAIRQEAESDFGIGTFGHILSTGRKLSQINAIHAISKLVVRKSALFKLIIQGNGLSLLINFLTDASKIISSNAVLYLCHLYQNIKKANSSRKKEDCCISKACDIEIVSKCAYKEALSDVTFCVNDINVFACRETICKNSNYFNAMLSGYFSENSKTVITMPDISAETLTTLFHFLHGCKTENSCAYIKRIPFAVLLELLGQCEKFLLFDVKAYIEDRLCHSLFPNTVCKIYRVAKINNSPALLKNALQFVLAMDVSQRDVLLKCFQEFLSLEEKYDFLNDIKIIIRGTFFK
ncbi:armadillo repeat-containing protein 5 [Caerostris darwini]|uniref:Armadillo repeat-containing protein 5 n=1 Tax=Caerostris darwini TaxID=1538125 RepID=A0AAV4SIW9_9ARAC|nr:armadillo repeat-containing protein 5 [Caerostris darwini]